MKYVEDDQDHTRQVPKQISDARRWNSTSYFEGDLSTACHKNIELDDESRNNHWNALIAQDGHSHVEQQASRRIHMGTWTTRSSAPTTTTQHGLARTNGPDHQRNTARTLCRLEKGTGQRSSPEKKSLFKVSPDDEDYLNIVGEPEHVACSHECSRKLVGVLMVFPAGKLEVTLISNSSDGSYL